MAEKLDFSVKSKIILAKINSNRKKSYQLFKPKQILCIKAALSQDTIGNQAKLLKETRKMSKLFALQVIAFQNAYDNNNFLSFLQYKGANLVGLFPSGIILEGPWAKMPYYF